MNHAILFNFHVNKEKNQIKVERSFNAPLDLVWAAWTEADILDQWWAPKPWIARTKTMDFREGGHWLYVMIGPENEEHWSRADFISVLHLKSFTAKVGFCDAEGNLNLSMPGNQWENTFSGLGESTRVDILLQFESLTNLESYIEMGFKEGFAAGLENLDQYIAAQFYLRKNKKA